MIQNQVKFLFEYCTYLVGVYNLWENFVFDYKQVAILNKQYLWENKYECFQNDMVAILNLMQIHGVLFSELVQNT